MLCGRVSPARRVFRKRQIHVNVARQCTSGLLHFLLSLFTLPRLRFRENLPRPSCLGENADWLIGQFCRCLFTLCFCPASVQYSRPIESVLKTQREQERNEFTNRRATCRAEEVDFGKSRPDPGKNIYCHRRQRKVCAISNYSFNFRQRVSCLRAGLLKNRERETLGLVPA